MRMLLAVIAVLAAGCASTPKSSVSRIAPTDQKWIASAPSISIDVEPAAKFERFGPKQQAQMMTGMMFGAIGGAAGAGIAIASARKEGALLVEKHSLTDPSLRVAEQMKRALSQYELTDEGKAYVLIRLTTKGWRLTKGRIGYAVELVAIKPARSAVLAKSECRILSDEGSDDNAMLADSAARLRAEQERAASLCADYFLEHVFAGARKG
ncbi:MAG: hypothetical protein ABIP56_03660 [Dokdonella sp.]